MKTVFKSHELSHLWAHQLQESGRCASHMRFDGKSFYSYSTEIVRIIERKGKCAYLLNETSYSVTTSAHQGDVRRAIPNGPVFHIGGIHMGNSLNGITGAQLFDHAIKQAADCADKAKLRTGQQRLARFAPSRVVGRGPCYRVILRVAAQGG